MDTRNPFLYLQIAEAFRRRIATGELKPGDRLPAVRDTAKQWDCTPGTVNRAYKTLSQEGLVVGQRGKGTLVAPSMIHSQSSVWNWASLINRAELFLLEAIHTGYTTVEVETALSIAIMRWKTLQVDENPVVEKQPIATATPTLRFVGSHDLVVDLIPHALKSNSLDELLSIQFAGSLGGLIAISRHEADLAGAHLWDETTDTYNLPFVKRILPGCRVALLTLSHRQLGLIVPRGNPQNIQGLNDLVRSGVRFVNRQPGSGSRVWLDAHLQRAGIRTDRIQGFKREETTHMGVANAIANGEASVGIGLFAAATSFELDFIPLTKERYDLVIPEQTWKLPQMQKIVDVVRSAHLKASINALGGYDASETGHLTWIE